jgi:Domain of unknown function (DUF4169)
MVYTRSKGGTHDAPGKKRQMATIVNLSKYRKPRDGAEAERRASENRARFGRTKQQRAQDALEAARARKEIEDKRLE